MIIKINRYDNKEDLEMKNANKEFNLLRSEIKKAERFATKANGRETRMTGFFYQGVSDLGFAEVICEMCSENFTRREDDVILSVPMFDRRKTWVRKAC